MIWVGAAGFAYRCLCCVKMRLNLLALLTKHASAGHRGQRGRRPRPNYVGSGEPMAPSEAPVPGRAVPVSPRVYALKHREKHHRVDYAALACDGVCWDVISRPRRVPGPSHAAQRPSCCQSDRRLGAAREVDGTCECLLALPGKWGSPGTGQRNEHHQLVPRVGQGSYRPGRPQLL